MPWFDHFQNVACSTIQVPASLDKESLLCGLASESPPRVNARAPERHQPWTRQPRVATLWTPLGRSSTGTEDHEPGPAQLTRHATSRDQHGRQRCRFSLIDTRKFVRAYDTTMMANFILPGPTALRKELCCSTPSPGQGPSPSDSVRTRKLTSEHVMEACPHTD